MSGLNFIGSVGIANPYYNVSLENLTLSFSKDSEIDNYSRYAIWANYLASYNSPWEWCVTYVPRFSGTTTVGILGTAGPFFNDGSFYSGDYYYNPTIEIWNGNEMWYGVTEHINSWEYQASTNLSESLVVGKSYSFIIGENSNGIYVKAKRNDTNTIIGQITNSATPQQVTYANRYPGLLCNNKDSKFKWAGDLDLSKTYYKENNIVLWGYNE